ncbi:lipoprotein [Williamsoniiplasma lucivorax]|uniref:Lipoprotein n=1 Tax=Williamsoniiplasma lucivorax TaxID=209274 RepID=A0A2S5RDF0_9MOLU|nr:lipoprotein [Williamsoniiplasma lucivorax]PPE05145.1 hypothetical protein ELUCI_v1c06810 [Williamsoniiplasma lucivorax]
MKKILSLLGAIGMIATTATTVVACAKGDTNANKDWVVWQYIQQTINQDLSKYAYGTITVEEVVESGKTGLVDEKINVLLNSGDPGEPKTNFIHFYAKQAGTINIKLVGQPKEQTTSQNTSQEPLPEKKTIETFTIVVKEATKTFKDFMDQGRKAGEMLSQGKNKPQEVKDKLAAVLIEADKIGSKKGVTDIELTQLKAKIITAMAEFEKA